MLKAKVARQVFSLIGTRLATFLNASLLVGVALTPTSVFIVGTKSNTQP